MSGNLDSPEGGFDAIVQAIVCGNEIGWRDEARRLLLFSTDAGFHFAGDGKVCPRPTLYDLLCTLIARVYLQLGGVITPNDGLCHLKDGLYEYSSIQDYPSISQINMLAKKHSVNIIFAVVEQQKSVYEKLSQLIEGSSCATLKNDSSNIVDLVKDEYSVSI